MTSAEQFANMLVVTHGYPELRAAGLDEFQERVRDVIDASSARLVAFSDESFMLDALRSDSSRDLTTFDSICDLSPHLLDGTTQELRELLADPGSDELEDDPTGPGEDEDDDSPELA